MISVVLVFEFGPSVSRHWCGQMHGLTARTNQLGLHGSQTEHTEGLGTHAHVPTLNRELRTRKYTTMATSTVNEHAISTDLI